MDALRRIRCADKNGKFAVSISESDGYRYIMLPEWPFMGRKHRDDAQPSSQQIKSGSNAESSGFHRLVKDFNNLNCGSLKVRKVTGGKFFDREGGLDPETIY